MIHANRHGIPLHGNIKPSNCLMMADDVLKVTGFALPPEWGESSPRYLAPEQLKALRHIATIESVGSSTRIEGVKLSDREVEKLLSGLTAKSFKSRDEEEVLGYAHVMEEVFASYEYSFI